MTIYITTFIGALALFLLIFLAKSFYLVQQSQAVIIEKLGSFNRILGPGLHVVIPFLEKSRNVVWTYVINMDSKYGHTRATRSYNRLDLRESVYDFPKQNVITKDNVMMEINALLYYQITDPKAAVYEISNLPVAIEKLTQTTLRNVIGSLDLDESLVSRDKINEKLRIILDEATDKWGVKVNRVELQEVNPPADIRQAMEKQMRAERERRAVILEAEGRKTAEILDSEGEKQSDILKSEGEGEARIIEAASKAEARVKIANAEAKAIELLKAALPEGSNVESYLVAMNYIKALPELAKGKNDKLVLMPFEANSLVNSVSSMKTLFDHISKK